MAKKAGMKLVANNKKAFHAYFIEDTYEAGIALAGTEVKSLRAGYSNDSRIDVILDILIIQLEVEYAIIHLKCMNHTLLYFQHSRKHPCS